ncbi:transcription elongation factor spt5 [Coemansia sp. BCRC 34301]|nr:transcription elongation factor spt5 [Coemansia sp. BCRC 34301]
MADGVADMFSDDSSDNNSGYSSDKGRRRSGKKPGTSSTTRRRQYSDDDDEDDEEEEEEEEDEEDERDKGGSGSEGSYTATTKRKPAKKSRKKRVRTNNFLDIEASVDTDEEEDEEDDGALGDFIVDNEAELASAEKDALRHRSAMRGPAGVFADSDFDEDAEAMEARLRARYSGYGDSGQKRAEAGGAAGVDGSWVAQRLLIPGIRDPHLWVCACLQGKERDIVLASARRVFQWHGKGKFDGVYSTFCRDGLSGHVYVEARSLAEARSALEGIAGVFVSKLALVPLSDMVDVVRIKARAPRINAGAWVRVRRGNYAGDLAQVVAVIEAADSVEVRLVPRLDYDGSGAKGERPVARLFSADDARRSDSRSLTSRQNEIMWHGDRFIGGYLHRDMRVAALQLHAAPTLDEITRFAGESGADDSAAIAALATAAAAADIGGPVAARDLEAGDAVQVIDGDLAGVAGVVSSIDGDVVRVAPSVGGALVSFAARQLQKRFEAGDHVKVLAGRHAGATGMVLVATDAVVTVHADVGGAELRVLARDLRVTSDVSAAGGGAVQAVVGMDLHDLVLLSGGQPAVVTRIAPDALTVLDDRGETRTVPPRDARPMRSSSDRAGVDCAGAPLRRGDAVREISGARREGSVIQITRFVAFVQPRGSSDLFVARTRQLEPANRRADASLFAARPSAAAPRPRPARPGALRGRDPLVGKTVVANRGPYKGYIGMVKDCAGDLVRVEMHTNARIISISRDKLSVKMSNGETVPATDLVTAAAAAAAGGGAPPPPTDNAYSSSSSRNPADARSPAGYAGWDPRSPAAYSSWDAPANGNSSSNSWGTPANSSSWDTPAAAAAAANTASSSWDTPANSSSWDTPANTASSTGWGVMSPAGLPQTPGGPLPQTPSNAYDAPPPESSSSSFFAWAVPRAVILLGPTRQRGTLTEVAAPRSQAIVRLTDGSTQVIDRSSLPRLDPQPMRAEKRDRVIVIRGDRRGAIGTMVGKDGSEAFFQPDGQNAWYPEPLRCLAVYDDNDARSR